jgi:deoxyribonuclease V
VEKARAVCRARFPYIPGLFTFRELPPLLAAFARLRRVPDALLFDGHGLAHPRRFGLACHAGLLLDRPAVGCAKSILVGEAEAVAERRGSRARLVHGGEELGAVLRTRDGVAPVFVSIGHRVDLDSAVELVLDCGGRYRLPEPLRLAHQATAEAMRRLDPGARPPRRRDYPDLLGAAPSGD